MAIPVAANVGGMGTPIGTPPNAIALKYLNDPEGLNLNIGFGEWMSFMLPYTIIVLFIAWFILLRLFPFKQKSIELQIEGEAKKDWRSIVVYITFAITVLLWMFDHMLCQSGLLQGYAQCEAAGYHPEYTPADLFQVTFGNNACYTKNSYRNHCHYIGVYSCKFVEHPQ